MCIAEPEATGEMPRLSAVLVDMHQQIHAEPRRGLVAKGDHLAEFPGGVDVQQRERRLARRESLVREVQHHARILADRIEHHRVFELGHGLAHDIDRLRLEAA